jgi:siroheme synthase
VAIIERAYAVDQRVTIATLGSVVETARREGVANPAIIVVGEVVSVPTLVTAPVLQAALADG